MQLDEDQAELRLFQEKFLEDGDLHTDYKRNKQFRWAGLEDNIEVSRGCAVKLSSWTFFGSDMSVRGC